MLWDFQEYYFTKLESIGRTNWKALVGLALVGLALVGLTPSRYTFADWFIPFELSKTIDYSWLFQFTFFDIYCDILCHSCNIWKYFRWSTWNKATHCLDEVGQTLPSKPSTSRTAWVPRTDSLMTGARLLSQQCQRECTGWTYVQNAQYRFCQKLFFRQ